MIKKKRWVVIVEEWDKEAYCWRRKRRITFEEACEALVKELMHNGE